MRPPQTRARGVLTSAPRLTASWSSSGVPEGGSRSPTSAGSRQPTRPRAPRPRTGDAQPPTALGRPAPLSLLAAPRAGSRSRGRTGGDSAEQEERRQGGSMEAGGEGEGKGRAAAGSAGEGGGGLRGVGEEREG